MHTGRARITTTVRNFLFNTFNREFLIFLVFLAISTGFWFVTALNETYEREIDIPINITDVPQNIIITDPMSDTIRITVKDKGYALLTYFYGDAIVPVKVSFLKHAKTGGRGYISTQELQKMIYPMLYASTKITSIKAERLDFYFNYGLSKRVPVLLDGQIKPAESYHIARTTFSPDSITIYASKNTLDSISEVYTELLHLSDFSDTIVRNMPLKKIKGVKMVPESVKVTLFTDMLTETNVTVPITTINTPSNLILRTFPSAVNVKVVIGRSKLPFVKPENFRVVVDYNEVAKHPSDKCTLSLRIVPKGITSATLETSQTDYLIEKVEP